MGQTLSSPATEKKSESGQDARFAYAVSEMQGWRISMEDAHVAELELENGSKEVNSFFAVYDGHGGSAAAKYAGVNVHKTLVASESYKAKRWSESLKRAFLDTDEEMRNEPLHQRDPSGCTAVAGLVTYDGKLFVANAGDSRAVLGIKGEVKPMSYDHKPQSETEKARIAGAGGYVEYGRVNGNLALSRALGDFEYKKNNALPAEAQIITADPDIIEHELGPDDEFLVIACDGIWDCLTSQQVVDIVRRKVAEGLPLEEIAELLCDHCLAPDTTAGAGIGCDNMTAMVIALLNGRTKEEWYAWIGERVRDKVGYETPEELPQIFAQSRMLAFQARQKAAAERDERDRERGFAGGPGGAVGGLLASSGLGNFARVLGSSGGLSFQPGAGIISDTGNLMFDKYDSDEDSDEDMEADAVDGRSFFADAFGAGNSGGEGNKSLRAQLAELEKDGVEGEEQPLKDDPVTDGVKASGPTQGEAPPPPPPAATGVDKPVQLVSPTLGDKPEPVVKAEGLLDKSEDPLKA